MENIVFVIYSYLTDYIKLWLVLWGIFKFTPIMKKNTFIISGIIQSIILIIAGLYYDSYLGVAVVSITVMVIVAICFVFEEKFLKKLAYSLLTYVLVMILDASLDAIFMITYLDSEKLGYHYICNSINVITISVFVFLKRRKSKADLQIVFSRRIYALLFTGAGTGFLIMAALLVRSNDKATETARRVMLVVSIIVVICYCAVCFMMVFVTESRDNYKAISLINQSVIESQQKYYTLVNEKHQEIRSIRHEMKNHLSCIHGLYMADKLPEMEQYISQLIDSSEMPADLLDTGNDIVNAILNDVQNRYRKDNIAIRLEGGFPRELHIAALDLCVIFANVITNAVESIQRLDRMDEGFQYVDLKISSFKDDLFIDVKNPIGEKVKILNGMLITAKKDTDFHGFGVKNIIQKVERYQGTYNYKIKNNQFIVEIQMKNAG